MKYVWKDLPEKKNCFTVRSARMVNLNTGKILHNYAANTKIVVVQKCITPNKTYYRTAEAAHNNLNYAFEAAAFGLPNEKAPSVPSKMLSSNTHSQMNERKPSSEKKQKVNQKVILPNDGEVRRPMGWLKRLFRRKNG